MAKVLGFLIRYFNNYYTLHSSDLRLKVVKRRDLSFKNTIKNSMKRIQIIEKSIWTTFHFCHHIAINISEHKNDSGILFQSFFASSKRLKRFFLLCQDEFCFCFCFWKESLVFHKRLAQKSGILYNSKLVEIPSQVLSDTVLLAMFMGVTICICQTL